MSLLSFLGPQTQQPASSEPSPAQNTPNAPAAGNSSNNTNQTSDSASQSSSDSVVISEEARGSSAPPPVDNSNESAPTQASELPSSTAPQVQSNTSTSSTASAQNAKPEYTLPTVYALTMSKIDFTRKSEPLEFEKIQAQLAKPVTSQYAIYTSAAKQYNAFDQLIAGKSLISEVA